MTVIVLRCCCSVLTLRSITFRICDSRLLPFIRFVTRLVPTLVCWSFRCDLQFVGDSLLFRLHTYVVPITMPVTLPHISSYVTFCIYTTRSRDLVMLLFWYLHFTVSLYYSLPNGHRFTTFICHIFLSRHLQHTHCCDVTLIRCCPFGRCYIVRSRSKVFRLRMTTFVTGDYVTSVTRYLRYNSDFPSHAYV